MKIGDIVEHKVKESERGYSHDGLYVIIGFCRMKNQATREWVDGVIYERVEKLDISLRFVREKTDFENKFKVVDNEPKNI